MIAFEFDCGFQATPEHAAEVLRDGVTVRRPQDAELHGLHLPGDLLTYENGVVRGRGFGVRLGGVAYWQVERGRWKRG